MQEKDLLAAILHELKEMKTSVIRLEKGQETLVKGQEALVLGQENLIKQVAAIKKDVAEINYIVSQGVFSDIARLEKRIERLEQKAV